MPDVGSVTLVYVWAPPVDRAVRPAPLSSVTALVNVPVVMLWLVSRIPLRTLTLPVPRAFALSKKALTPLFAAKSQLTFVAVPEVFCRITALAPDTVAVLPDPESNAAMVRLPPLTLIVPPPEPIVIPRAPFIVTAVVVRSAAPFEIVIRSVAKTPTPPRLRSWLICRVPVVIASLVVKLLVAVSTNVPTPSLMMDGVVALERSTAEIVAVAPVPRALTVIVALLVPLFIVIVEVPLKVTPVPLTIQLAADDVSASPKTNRPRVLLVSSVTVRLAVMLLANVAVPPIPCPIVLFSQLVVPLQRPSASTFQLPFCAKAGPESDAPSRPASRSQGVAARSDVRGIDDRMVGHRVDEGC